MAWIEDAFGRVLMVKQRAGKKLWALPGGKVKPFESLASALAREVFEETGLRVKSASACDYFDRHEKSNLTVLFTASVRTGTELTDGNEEIESAAFRASPPRNCTPSLAYFWTRRHPIA